MSISYVPKTFYCTLRTILTPFLPSQNYQHHFISENSEGKRMEIICQIKVAGAEFFRFGQKRVDIRCFCLTGIHISIFSLTECWFSFRNHPYHIFNPQGPEGLMGCPGFKNAYNTPLANENTLPTNHCDWCRDGHMTQVSQSEPNSIGSTELAETIGRKVTLSAQYLNWDDVSPGLTIAILGEPAWEWSPLDSIIWTVLQSCWA